MSEENESTTNGFIDKLTLELLMNKNHYNRYLSQNDPKKHIEHLEHLEKVKKYRNAIIDITNSFLDNPNNQVTTEVNDAYDYYIRTLVRHLEYKKIENNDDDDEVLFGDMEKESYQEPATQSFWSKNKVVKKQADIFNDYSMKYIPRVKVIPES
jgi:hypothetical protein